MQLSFRLNGRWTECEVAPDRFLLDLLRDDLGLQGTKEACDEGECGACTVLIDGAPVDSCILFAGRVQGREVTTIEGLSADGRMHPLQTSFVEEAGIQCGYCTPGFVLAAAALLADDPNPPPARIREALAGNLCRCTGYGAIIAAVRAAAEERSR
jgi:aerobic carbon-monoxide dehydrogenase small subunit